MHNPITLRVNVEKETPHDTRVTRVADLITAPRRDGEDRSTDLLLQRTRGPSRPAAELNRGDATGTFALKKGSVVG